MHVKNTRNALDSSGLPIQQTFVRKRLPIEIAFGKKGFSFDTKNKNKRNKLTEALLYFFLWHLHPSNLPTSFQHSYLKICWPPVYHFPGLILITMLRKWKHSNLLMVWQMPKLLCFIIPKTMNHWCDPFEKYLCMYIYIYICWPSLLSSYAFLMNWLPFAQFVSLTFAFS